MGHEEAREVIVTGRGTHFDPDVVDAFITIEDTIINIAKLYAGMDFMDARGHMVSADEKVYDIENVLVVDDSRVVLVMIENQLSSIGYNVKTAQNGEEAYALFQNNAFDLIITDLEMPVLNGYELVSRIRNSLNGHGKDVIIIAMTASPIWLYPGECTEVRF